VFCMEKYRRLQVLGSGTQSTVFLVQDGETGEHLAVKQMEAKSQLSGADSENSLKEAALLFALKHPHIIEFRDAFVTRLGNFCLIMEYAEGGDMNHYLENQRLQGTMLTEAQVLKWFYELCTALQYLHGLNVLHRDIKARNIFLRSSGIVQLGDFGISTIAGSPNGHVMSAVCTPTYASPERVRREAYDSSADIWSLGIVLYELCALRRPFEAEALSALTERILSGEYAPLNDSLYSPEIRCAVSHMLTQQPEARPTAADLLNSSLLINVAIDLGFMARQGSNSSARSEMETVFLTDAKPEPISSMAHRPSSLEAPGPAGPSHGPTCGSWVPREPTPREAVGSMVPLPFSDVPVERLPDEVYGFGNVDSPESPKPAVYKAWSQPAPHDQRQGHLGHIYHGARRLLGFEH